MLIDPRPKLKSHQHRSISRTVPSIGVFGIDDRGDQMGREEGGSSDAPVGSGTRDEEMEDA